MKKLYRKGTVFPSPPLVSDQLSFLPAAIFTLTAALSQEDKQVLAYLLSCPSGNFSTTHKNSSPSGKGGGGADHPPSFNCFCFNCYRSYWARNKDELRKSEVMMGLNKDDSGEADAAGAAAALPSHGGEGEEEGGEKGSVRRLWVKAVNEHKRTAYICPGEQGRMDG
nr:neurogenic protein mastermind [Ipomoea batatas]